MDAQSPLTAEELDVLRQQYADESTKGWVSVQTKFNYAWGSVKSDNHVEVGEGVALLMGTWPILSSRTTISIPRISRDVRKFR